MGKWGFSRRKIVTTYYFQSVLLMLMKSPFPESKTWSLPDGFLYAETVSAARIQRKMQAAQSQDRTEQFQRVRANWLCTLLLSVLALFSSRKRPPWQRKFPFTAYYISVELLWDLAVREQQEESEAAGSSRLWGAELLGSRAGAFQARKRSGHTGGSYFTSFLDGNAAGCYFVRLIGVAEGSCEEKEILCSGKCVCILLSFQHRRKYMSQCRVLRIPKCHYNLQCPGEVFWHPYYR